MAGGGFGFSGGGSSITLPVSVANGGTGLSSYTVGDLIYASGATTLSKLADVATGSVLVSGGVGVAPSWSTSLTLTSNISAGAAGSIGFTGRSIIKSPADGFFAFSNAAATAFADVVVGTVTSGNASSTNGSFILKNSTNANTVTITSGATSSSYSWTLPTAQGGASTFLTNNGSGVLSWTTPSLGITVGGTAITSGTDYRVLFQDATASDYVTQTANFTMGAVASGFLDVPAGYALAGHKLISEVNTSSIRFGNGAAPSMTGATNTVIGYANAAGLTSGVNNVYLGTGQAIDVNSATSGNGVVIGANAGIYTQGSGNVVLGSGAGSNIIANNTIIGYLAGGDVGTYKYYEKTVMLGGGAGSAMKASSVGTISIGYFSCYQAFDCNYGIFIGYGAGGFSAHNSASFGTYSGTTAANQLVFGGSYAGTSHYSDVYFGSGVNDAAAKSVVINATGGSGASNNGGNLTLKAGLATGAGIGGYLDFMTAQTAAASSTLQTGYSRLRISNGAVTTNASTATWADALDFVFSGTTGTKIGTANTQKLAFWNATPIVQPSGATQAAPAAYATGAFGLDSDANMQALYDLVVAMRTALVNVGIMKGSA